MKRPAKNLVAFFAGEVGGRLIGFAISVYLARIVEVSAFGILNIGFAVLAYLAMVSSPGIQLLETRNVAASDRVDLSRVGSILSMRLFLSGVLLVWVAVGAFLFINNAETRDVVILVTCALFPMSFLLDWFFQGREDFAAVSYSKVVNSLGYGVMVVLLVHSHTDVRMAALSFVVGSSAAAFFLFMKFRRSHGRLDLGVRFASWKNILAENFHVGVVIFLAQSVQSFPPLLIGIVYSSAETGLYSAAMKLILLSLLLDRGLNALLLPAMSRYFSRGRDEIKRLFAVALRSLLMIILPAAIVGFAVSSMIVVILFGESYRRAIPVVQVLLAYGALTLVNTLFMTTLIGAKREKEYTRAMIPGTLAGVVAVVIFTFLAGIVGAAWGVVVGEFVTVVLMGIKTRRMLEWSAMRSLGPPLIAALAMSVALLLAGGMELPSQIGISILTYLILLVSLRGIRKDDILYLKEKLV